MYCKSIKNLIITLYIKQNIGLVKGNFYQKKFIKILYITIKINTNGTKIRPPHYLTNNTLFISGHKLVYYINRKLFKNIIFNDTIANIRVK